jgi:hypothetical protein
MMIIIIVARTGIRLTTGFIGSSTQLELQCTHFTIHYSTLHCLHSAVTLDCSL